MASTTIEISVSIDDNKIKGLLNAIYSGDSKVFRLADHNRKLASELVNKDYWEGFFHQAIYPGGYIIVVYIESDSYYTLYPDQLRYGLPKLANRHSGYFLQFLTGDYGIACCDEYLKACIGLD